MNVRTVQPKTAIPAQTLTLVRHGMLQRKCACGGAPGIDGECAECRRKRLALQNRSPQQTGLSTVPPIVHNVLRSPGQALDPGTRAFMGPRFRHDFSQVRIDTAVSRRMQTKLSIGRPGDIYEQEADRVAEQVMRTAEPQSLREATVSGQVQGPHLQRLCSKCAEEEEKKLQAKTALGQVPEATTNVENDLGLMKGSGQPLPSSLCTFFESRFGHDFSQVRLHTGKRAAYSARAVNALAYTVGRDVVFGYGQFQPETTAGRRLLAHELTHVVQQGQAPSLEGRHRDGASVDGSMSIAAHDTGPIVRRAVAVPESKSELHIEQEPSANLEVKNLLGWKVLPKTPQKITFKGKAEATCDPGDSPAGYVVGIIQMQTREVNNARYQGATSADGSVWIRRDIPAVRPQGPCQDSAYGSIGQGKGGALFWNDSKPVICGRPVELTYDDFPQDMYETIITNPLTKQPNYLQEMRIAFDFTTALMLKRPNNNLQTLRWARWHEAWDYTFDTPPSGESKVRRGIAQVGTVEFAVAMPSPPELPTRFALPAKNCNTIDYEASDNPARIQASRTW